MRKKFVIIENEYYARESLVALVRKLRPNYELVFTAESVDETVEFFSTGPEVDLVFMDIELVDGDCFEIFNKVHIETPVIFTTAYNHFALDAFKVNSVDYLLKPVSEGSVSASLDKFEKYIYKSQQESQSLPKSYRSRILVNVGDAYSSVDIDNVRMFVSEDKYVFVCTSSGSRRLTDYQNLNDVENDIDPLRFFRVSRNMVISIDSVVSVKKHNNSRLIVASSFGKEVVESVVSAARKDAFLQWYGDGR